MREVGADGTTLDALLGGQITIAQPARGYRAGSDAVLLAAACPAQAGEAVLDLGCGVGAASLCLGRRVPELRLWGLEKQEEYAVLARANAGRNALALEVHVGDIEAMPPALRRPFDQVIANPPWHARGGTPSPLASRALALQAAGPLTPRLRAAARRLRPGGTLTLIASAARLGEMLAALAPDLGAAVVLPLAAREGAPAGRVILRARKDARAPLVLLAPLILHGEGGGDTGLARAALAEGASLDPLFAPPPASDAAGQGAGQEAGAAVNRG